MPREHRGKDARQDLGHLTLMTSLSGDSDFLPPTLLLTRERLSGLKNLHEDPRAPISVQPRARKKGQGNGEGDVPADTLLLPPPFNPDRTGSRPRGTCQPVQGGGRRQSQAPPCTRKAPCQLLRFGGGGAPTFSGEQSKPRKVTPFLNEIELPFSSSSQMSAALDQIRS